MLVRPFPGTGPASIAEVGGKGASLIRLADAGLPVPPGFVLTAAFFAPRLERLRATPAGRAFQAALGTPDEAPRYAALAAVAEAESPGAAEEAALAEALRGFAPDDLFAVRSSSPEEDLAGASFAGLYRTLLGVRREGVPAAVRAAFASCFEARVAVYKRTRGFAVDRPRIAVVVQRQVAADAAGVVFSLHPVTNAYDEAVIHANWGLGETVVSGEASPDEWVVDKVARRVIARRVGRKEVSLHLKPGGGLERREHPDDGRTAIDEPDVLALADYATRIEAAFGAPVDVEWARAAGALFLLQARPITTAFHLPTGLVTPPGAPRRLYWDVTISVQGLLRPISPMGTSVLRRLIGGVSRRLFGRNLAGSVDDALPVMQGGRIYMNLSNAMTLEPLAALARAIDWLDPTAAGAVRAADEATYRSARRFGPRLLGVLPRVPAIAARIVGALLEPALARRRVADELRRFFAGVRAAATGDPTAAELVARLLPRVEGLIFRAVLPTFGAARIAASVLRRRVAAEDRAHAAPLDQSLPGNVTVEMGLALADLAARLPAGVDAAAFADVLDGRVDGDGRERAEPAERAGRTERAAGAGPSGPAIDASVVSEEFRAGWRRFLERYGHRGPGELDVAVPRFRERPEALLDLLARQAGAGPDAGPHAAHERSAAARREAARVLQSRADARGRFAGWVFRTLYRALETLGGLRETPKYALVYALDRVRDRLRAEGEALARAGRLDRPEEVFDLALEDLERARAPGYDLRGAAAAHRAEHERVGRAPELPRVVDSRGRIFRPRARPAGPGEIAGHPVSAGVARGPARVLLRPDEKPVLPGDVLVTRATDPGWTPLFVPAAAVVLEVGGMLQHGALVAREYGKPCVAGAVGAVERLKDGMWVEVDGTAGVVRILAGPPAE